MEDSSLVSHTTLEQGQVLPISPMHRAFELPIIVCAALRARHCSGKKFVSNGERCRFPELQMSKMWPGLSFRRKRMALYRKR